MALPTTYQEFIYKRTYSRWIEEEKRREEWEETVDRYCNYMGERVPKAKLLEFRKACEAIKRLEIVPSMRALWTAGKALERDNIAGYNCSCLVVDDIKAFSEALYILLNGTGVGYSVESNYVEKLPIIPEKLEKSDEVIEVADSKLGWAKAYHKFVQSIYQNGVILKIDVSKVRPKGAPLKTFGGRASGPEPLIDLFNFSEKLFKNAQGRRLTTLECHDIMCYIANIVVVGGTRRSAMISLSDRNDDLMAHCKDGEFWLMTPQRGLANNSAVYDRKPTSAQFLEDWTNLIRSGSGERGIFNRESARFIVSQIGRRSPDHDFGTNPCSEIILRPFQFCNLTEVIIRPEDDKETLCRKARQATILGVVQSTLTKFGFIGRKWKKNTEEERLLGVSLTGLRDHPVLGQVNKEAKLLLTEMKQTAIETAREFSAAFEIPMPTAITAIKPSGTVSQLVNSASGLHPRYSPFYIRRVRVASNDPISKFLIETGVPNKPEVGQNEENCTIRVFEFPIKSPENAVMRDETNAIQQLNYWLMLQKHWCEHKPSCTIYVKDEEWIEVGAWVYKNWNYVSGISFLPYDGGVYQLAPYEEITEEEYNDLIKDFPEDIDFAKLVMYEGDVDSTEGSKEYACTGGSCEI